MQVKCPKCGSRYVDEYDYASSCHACGSIWANSEPPDDGREYACVWIEVKRDENGERTCDECSCFRTFSYDPDAGSVEWCEIQDEPLPDCPLGSD